MTSKHIEPWLWVGICFTILIGVRTISSQLRTVEALHTTSQHSKRALRTTRERAARQPEDDIPLATLHTLSHCPTPDIRDAASKIICDRFLRSSSAQATLKKLHASPSAADNQAARDVDALVNHYRIFMEYDSASGSMREGATEEQGLFLPVTMVQEGDVMEVGEGTAGAGSQALNESPEEAALRRRRRREAVVVAGEDEEAVVLQPGGLAWDGGGSDVRRLIRTEGDGVTTYSLAGEGDELGSDERSLDLSGIEGVEVQQTGIRGLVVVRPVEED